MGILWTFIIGGLAGGIVYLFIVLLFSPEEKKKMAEKYEKENKEARSFFKSKQGIGLIVVAIAIWLLGIFLLSKM